ncbi:hypothetical protein [Xenorhabdus bovienii]|uniref:hypothetical protein n=1 Tax=Xenorhabdus bovienii TaxID=40576 RepID=UPI0023B23E41|nr:hypothetical protein [Xenorhabdus bovienii]MDE9428850.1 hypothetical protein [Xenorhabdus bovienii]
MCNSIIEFLDENEITEHPDYYISKAILARENREYITERQSVLHLLFFIEKKPILISELLNKIDNMNLTEKTQFLLGINKSTSILHPYIRTIITFILSGTKQQINSYFNCFLGRSPKYGEIPPLPAVDTLSIDILLNFYEATHRFLINTSPGLAILEKMTKLIYAVAKEKSSQSVLFFMSYFNTDINPRYAIDIANTFFDADNISLENSEYTQSLAYNTALAATKIGDISEAEHWLDYIDDDDKKNRIISIITEIDKKQNARKKHPLNPKNIKIKNINEIETLDLISICSFLDGCGDDWGFKELYRSGSYIFPSKILTTEMFKSLAVKGIITLTQQDFDNIEKKLLNDFDHIVNNFKFHLNVIGIIDNRKISIKIFLEEIDRRKDKFDASFEMWKEISTGYFHDAMEYYLGNIRDSWSNEFMLNEKTIERLSTTCLSAKDLSYIASSSVRYSAGQHAIKYTQSNRHTCNTLISSINKNIDWVESDKFLGKAYPRGKKQPVLSSERIIEHITNINPDDLYNNVPKLTEPVIKDETESDK